MICNRDEIDLLAARIERAYRRRRRGWIGYGQTSGVWEAAASRLLEASRMRPGTPVDPELFVAVLAGREIAADPWMELTQRSSLDRYFQVLRRIVSQLRREIRQEMRRAGSGMASGKRLDQVLKGHGGRISPLGCYILAHRAGREDLAEQHRASAERQHRSCPLYRQAIRSLLPGRLDHFQGLETESARLVPESVRFSLN